VATPPRSAWAERQFLERQVLERQALERQVLERQVAPPRVERSVSTPTAEPTASPWSARNLGEAP
jgi:hypothetical protein